MIDIRKRYDDLFVQKTLLLQDKRIKMRKLKKVRAEIKTATEAHYLLTETSKIIQKQFKKKVETLITYMVQAVYNRPYIFELQFDTKRNSVEVTPIIKKGNTRLMPKKDMGGGLLDVISFGFRIILWYMQQPRSRPILFLDEPFKFLGRFTKEAGQVLQYLTTKFNMQILLTTHDQRLEKHCDKIYIVRYNGIEATVKRKIKRRK